MAISGLGVFYGTAGLVLLWSGIKGQPVSSIIRQVAGGQQPSGTNTERITAAGSPDVTSAAAAPAAGSSTSASNPSGSAGGSASVNQGIARMLAIANGHPSWTTGQQWADWMRLWNQESGWSASARNPSSGAFGIAQALGHGGAGTAAPDGTNEYGTQFGLTAAQARAANGGNASDQILWGIGYLASTPNPYGPTYGSPSAAWAHEQANNWY